MDSLAFLERPEKSKTQSVYVLHGDEPFLKRQVSAALRRVVLEGEDNEFGLSTYEGDKATFAAVCDELQTLPFLGSRRLVIVENADPFVTRYRAALEKYVAAPSTTGVLVLDVKSWPSNTRLAKLLGDAASISCKAPATYRLPDWCRKWAQQAYGKTLAAPAAQLLVDLVGPEMGLLDQELAKLAIYVGKAEVIDTADVDKLVGSSRAESIWKIFDAIGSGRVPEALAILDGLFAHAEEPLRILGAFSMQLRRLTQAARLNARGQPLPAALARAGIAPFAVGGSEQQLRHLGRRRIEQLYDWLLAADLGLKGSSQLPPRTLLEQFVVKLARKN
jgi:DNA polymerase III subunit delta